MLLLGTYIYHYNWNFFDTPSEELYYFLGFVAADGYISGNGIEIGLAKNDIALLERFRDLICPEKPLYVRTKTNSFTLKISCKNKISKFKNFFSLKSNNKGQEMKFPDIPKKYVKDFIRGYIDGDGCIDTTKAYKGNKTYIGPRLRILSNFDFLTTLNEKTKDFVLHKTNAISKKGKDNVYCVTYNFSTAKNLLKWLYKDCKICLDRKYQKAKEVTKAW